LLAECPECGKPKDEFEKNSTFAPDGKVLSGIAKEPLPQYEAKIEGDLILVKNI